MSNNDTSLPKGGGVCDTHHYDHKLKDRKITIYRIDNVPLKCVIFQKLLSWIPVNDTSKNLVARRCIEVIQKDMCSSSEHERERNYDPSNGLWADDLLASIVMWYTKNKDLDTLPILIEQLSDVLQSGQCPQGRCIRLFQIYVSLEAASSM